MIDPPWRTSTYERPFTQEGNYLVLHLCLECDFAVTASLLCIGQALVCILYIYCIDGSSGDALESLG